MSGRNTDGLVHLHHFLVFMQFSICSQSSSVSMREQNNPLISNCCSFECVS